MARRRRSKRRRRTQGEDRPALAVRLMPGMFHRRLALLLLGVLAGFLVISGRVAYLTVVRGDELRATAERALLRQRWTPTVRGRILDRHGRVLAEDAPSFEVAVDYEVISGEWAQKQAYRKARRDHARMWPDLDAVARTRLVAQERVAFDAQLDEYWDRFARMAGVEREELERRKAEVLAEVQRVAASVWERARERRQAELERRLKRPVEVALADVARPIREQVQPHVLLRSVPDDVALGFRRLQEEMPGLRVTDAGRRMYPHETITVEIDRSTFPTPMREQGTQTVETKGVATHILGWMRSSVFAEDIAARPERDPDTGEIDRGHYQVGDRVGQTGIEASMERELRGLRGLRITHLDTGEIEELPAEPGEDIHLTIDAALQARVQAVMSPEVGLATVQEWHVNEELPVGTPLNGAAVVLDIATGEILAMVTTPSFTREDLAERPGWVFRNPIDFPWVNRAIEAPYPPGSIAKAMVFAHAVSTGAHPMSAPIRCTGHLLPGRTDVYRCWIYKRYGLTHSDQTGGALSGAEALTVSCNIYFYTLGRELGPRGIAETYRRFGVGEPWGLGVGAEHTGTLGTGSGVINESDAILMGIGQGPVAWTPLHAADAYATLARGGLRIVPRIIADAPAQAMDLRLDPAAIEEAMHGLRGAVNDDRGTGSRLVFEGGRDPIFNAKGVDVRGKTGTATAPPLVFDPDGPEGPAPASVVRQGDHSWFVVDVGPEGQPPRYAIAVIMEYGGSGGKVSGPITNQIVHALIDEGYLPDHRATAAAPTTTGGAR